MTAPPSSVIIMPFLKKEPQQEFVGVPGAGQFAAGAHLVGVADHQPLLDLQVHQPRKGGIGPVAPPDLEVAPEGQHGVQVRRERGALHVPRHGRGAQQQVAARVQHEVVPRSGVQVRPCRGRRHDPVVVVRTFGGQDPGHRHRSVPVHALQQHPRPNVRVEVGDARYVRVRHHVVGLQAAGVHAVEVAPRLQPQVQVRHLRQLQPVREVDPRKGLALHEGVAVVHRDAQPHVGTQGGPEGHRLRTGGVLDARPLLAEGRRYHRLPVHPHIGRVVHVHMVHVVGDHPFLLGMGRCAK